MRDKPLDWEFAGAKSNGGQEIENVRKYYDWELTNVKK